MFNKRKIYTTGTYTLAVNIPKEIAKKAELKKGNFVTLLLDKNKNVVLKKVK